MGKGDMKTRRGKIHNGTHGTRRPKKHKKSIVPQPVKAKKSTKK